MVVDQPGFEALNARRLPRRARKPGLKTGGDRRKKSSVHSLSRARAPAPHGHISTKRKRLPTFLLIAFVYMPATTYSPTHFRVQYNRPCGA